MMDRFRKGAIAALAALTLGLSITSVSTPAEARWRGGYYRGGWGWGGPVAAGVIGGLALGGLAAAATYPGYPGYYPYGPYAAGGCYPQRQPAYDGWGRFIGYRVVRICY
jgi:hypothetical protein